MVATISSQSPPRIVTLSNTAVFNGELHRAIGRKTRLRCASCWTRASYQCSTRWQKVDSKKNSSVGRRLRRKDSGTMSAISTATPGTRRLVRIRPPCAGNAKFWRLGLILSLLQLLLCSQVDLTQAGQCIGAIDEIKHAAVGPNPCTAVVVGKWLQ